MTGNTKKIALQIKEYYDQNSIKSDVIDVNKTDKNEIIEKVKTSDIVFFGSATKYADMIGSMEEILKELKELNLEGKYAVSFGSYGWSGEPIEIMQDYLNESSFTTLNTSDIVKTTGMTDVNFPIRIRFSLNEQNKEILKRAVYYTIDKLTA